MPRHAAARAQAVAAKAYTLSYLVLFALAGTLARLALQALTIYPGAPVAFASVWPNFAGSFVFGLVADDRVLPRPSSPPAEPSSPNRSHDGDAVPDPEPTVPQQPRKPPATTGPAKTPLSIGLATGFCGSFTSFSSFVRDAFLALINGLPPPAEALSSGLASDAGSSGGRSFMALAAVLLSTVSLSLVGLFAGAHLAQALKPMLPALARDGPVRALVDRAALVVAWAAWLAAVVLAAAMPVLDTWLRGQVLFALAFAPLGCLGRFYVSAALNGRLSPRFPLGTFLVNVAGTAVLAVAWDLAHAHLGGLVGCLVLQGLEDGFCGCLTTVSTWVAELVDLARCRPCDAYVYGALSILVALLVAIAIMGGLAWSRPGDLGLYCVY